eukprot:4179947-Amphidinium_carterae.1
MVSVDGNDGMDALDWLSATARESPLNVVGMPDQGQPLKRTHRPAKERFILPEIHLFVTNVVSTVYQTCPAQSVHGPQSKTSPGILAVDVVQELRVAPKCTTQLPSKLAESEKSKAAP